MNELLQNRVKKLMLGGETCRVSRIRIGFLLSGALLSFFTPPYTLEAKRLNLL